MSDELKDILSNSNKDIDNQRLMDYLNDHLSKEQQHEVEKTMADDPFVNDAVEGLGEIGNEKNVQDYTEQLNSFLQKQTAKNKDRKRRRRWKDSPDIYMIIMIVLTLIMICFFVLKKMAG
ncbi:MAG: hypothetical protein QM791_00990 [Ferruginibacter sp.]